MTIRESKKLQPDMRIGFLDLTLSNTLPIDQGKVLANNKHAVQIQWDDIENSGCENGIGWVSHEDAAFLIAV